MQILENGSKMQSTKRKEVTSAYRDNVHFGAGDITDPSLCLSLTCSDDENILYPSDHSVYILC